MNDITKDLFPPPPGPRNDLVEEGSLRTGLVLLGVLLVGAVLGGRAAMLATHASAVPVDYSPQATSITPITSTGDAASGMLFSGDGYDVACTVSAAAATIYPAVHNGTAWSVLWQFPCVLDGTVLTKPTCIFPARRESGNTWNVFKTGAATVNACTAVQRYGPIPTSKAPPASGAGSGSVSSVAMSVPAALLSVAGSPITSTGTLAVTLGTRAANLAFLGPASGADATPAFRAMVPLDLATSADNGEVLSVSGGALAWATPSAANPTGSGAALTDVYAGFIFTSGSGAINAGVQYMGGPGTALAGVGGFGVFTAPVSGLTATSLGCEVDTAPGGAETATFTLMESTDHGATYGATLLTCTMAAGVMTCAGGAPAALTQYARYAVSAQGSAGTAAADATCSFRVSK
jgi:hypothetical protein